MIGDLARAKAEPRRILTAARVEDWLVAGWLAVVAPLMAWAAGSMSGPTGAFETGNPVLAVIRLAGFAGALACLGTRSPAPPANGGPDQAPPRDGLATAAIGPLVGGLMLVGGSGLAGLGLDPDPAFAITMIAAIVFFVGQGHLPVLATTTRRALATPYLIAAGGIFWAVVRDVTGGIDFGSLIATPGPSAGSGAGFVALFLLLGGAVYYAMLIYAPRQVVEREGNPIVWLLRFALFVASVAVGVGWLSLLGG